MDKLRELQEQASPGDWKMNWGTRDDVPDVLSLDRLDHHAETFEAKFATAKLAALATHLFPIAEALEACAGKLEAQDIREQLPPSAELEEANEALKNLQEALE